MRDRKQLAYTRYSFEPAVHSWRSDPVYDPFDQRWRIAGILFKTNGHNCPFLQRE